MGKDILPVENGAESRLRELKGNRKENGFKLGNRL